MTRHFGVHPHRLRVFNGGRSVANKEPVMNDSVDPLVAKLNDVDSDARIAAAQVAIEAALNQAAWDKWDIRFAGLLNQFATAMFHGGHKDWTNVHVRQLREAMAISERVVFGDAAASVPSGFGEPVRAQLGEAAQRLIAQLSAIPRRPAAEPAGTGEGAQESGAGPADDRGDV
jgi:hypothetical protein